MRLFFVGPDQTALADPTGAVLDEIRQWLLAQEGIEEVASIDGADAVLLQERVGFKEWRYVARLLEDQLIGPRLGRVYTVNQDDCATGLLKGAYSSLPRRRFDRQRHVLIPYPRFPNPLIAKVDPARLGSPTHLASWRGNPKSCLTLRGRLLQLFADQPGFLVENTGSWLNHGETELVRYLEVLAAGRFALCPRGWTPMTYRIYESLALARVPVLLADGLVLPQGPDWPAISLQVPERQLPRLPLLLRQYEADAEVMGMRGRQAWLDHYSPQQLMPGISSSLLNLIRRDLRISANHDLERQRMQGLRMAWANRWTLPQRFVNRIRRVGRQS